ncbi:MULTISPECIES: hypothetical protein [Rubritalea]|nr:hypothetical protein [Rubritalea squalenifaciens]
MSIPEGWTDDMNIELPHGHTQSQVAEFIMSQLDQRIGYDTAIQQLISEFGIDDEDAYLAYDRTQGGIIRALTCQPANKPNKRKDPIAHHSFNVVWEELPKKHLFSQEKKAAGKWHRWYLERKS